MKLRPIVWLWIVIGLLLFAAVNAPLLMNHFKPFTQSQAEYAEHFGAFVGGYFGSLFALVSVCLLFATLQSQQSDAAEQNLANARQNFETKYFELLRMHRDNVQEIGLKGGSGRKLFVLLLRELREALAIVSNSVEDSLLSGTILRCVPFTVVLPEGHSCAAKDSVTLKDLSSMPWVLFERHLHPALYDSFLNRARELEIKVERIHHIADAEEACETVRLYGGAAFLSPQGAERAAESVSICCRCCSLLATRYARPEWKARRSCRQ